MSSNKVKFKIKGHESFYIREGWLRKGIKNLDPNYNVFLRKDAVDKLGVGSNMVKSIRYWLQVTGLTEEKTKKSKRIPQLTEFGKDINEKDPYFEDIFTLWLLHYNIAKNSEKCTTWYLFFNEFNSLEFTKLELIETMKILMNKFTNNSKYSEKSLSDDCNCLLKTYCYEKYKDKNPEENLMSIFNSLHVLEMKRLNGVDTYIRNIPSMNILDKLAVYYVILDNLKGSNSVSIQDILENNNNAGKIFNLDRNILNEYLDLLVNEGYIDVNRTAGLDKIYIKQGNKHEILNKYYDEV